MHYTALTLEGFGFYKDKTTFDFDNQGTLIQGDNGRGKTTIFDAINFTLFGLDMDYRNPREKESIINDKSVRASVTLTVVEDGVEHEITRSLGRKDGAHTVSHTSNGTTQRGVTTVKDIIDTLTHGTTYPIYKALFYMGSAPSSAVNNFTASSPKDRRELLSTIVDPQGEYAQAHKDVKKNITAVNSEMKTLQGEQNSISSILDTLGSDEDVSSQLDDAEKTYASLQKQLSNYESVHGSPDGAHKVQRAYDAYVTNKDILDRAKKTLEVTNTALDQAYDQRDSLGDTENTLRTRVADIEDSLATQATVIDDARKLMEQRHGLFSQTTFDDSASAVIRRDLIAEHAQSCSVCHQELPDLFFIHDFTDGSLLEHSIDPTVARSDEKSLQAYMEDMKRTQKALADVTAKLRTVEKDVRTADAQCDAMDSQLRTHQDDYNRAVAQFTESKATYEELNKLVDSHTSGDASEAEYADLQAQLAQAQEVLMPLRIQNKSYESTLFKRAEVQKKYDAVLEQEEKLSTEREELNEEKERTSPNGEVSEKIHIWCDDVSKRFDTIYNTYFDGKHTLEFILGGDDTEPTCLIMFDGRNMNTYSHGEQLRIITALSYAMMASWAETHTWIPPLWDEPALGVDREASRHIDELFYGMTQNEGQGFIISRDPDTITNGAVLELA